MISKELIKAEIERVPDERLDVLYSVVKEFARPATANGGPSLMSKLREISIDGPEDFAENIDLYLSGEKTIG
ncbi:MAG TPA: hypothetical protein VE969_11045 [Pyrinomonadaceae bacterium]|jgi:hypothetical protein|nr:hypothetical protein [Pyrinomonadaceae bacterium]